MDETILGGFGSSAGQTSGAWSSLMRPQPSPGAICPRILYTLVCEALAYLLASQALCRCGARCDIDTRRRI